MCYWTDARIPAGKTITAGLLGATADFGDLIGPGDSGGPVVNASGVMHGIIKGNSADFNMLLYTSTAQFFHEQPDYEIAPPN